MATVKGVGARLQLSVDDAIKQLTTLKTKLESLRTDAAKPIPISLVVDTSKLDDAATKVKELINPKGTTKNTQVTQLNKQLVETQNTLKQILASVHNLNTNTREFKETFDKTFTKNGNLEGFSKTIVEVRDDLQGMKRDTKDLGQEWLNFAATTTRAIGQAAEGLENLYGTYRNFGQNLLTGFQSFASNILETVGFSVSGMIDDAIDQEKKLQQARIGFSNMFPGQDTSAMIQQVRSTAAASPGLNSGDLADYINQLGAVAGGDFGTAFNATMGILKTVQYGGGDAASQMGYIIKNIRDVMAKGKGTQVDVQQFNRAMPLLQKSLQAIGASEFLKDGQLTITKENAKNLMAAFAQLNTEDNPAYNIFEQTGMTLGGLQEEFRETVSTQIATMFEDIGLFDSLATIMRGSVFQEIEAGLESFANWIKEIRDAIDWGSVGKIATEVLNNIKTAIGEFGRMIKDNFGNTEFLNLVVKTIGAFFEGLINGATELGKFLAHIKNTLGEEGFTNLARSLGQSVTQGVLLQKALSAVAEGFNGVASVIQTIAFGRFLTRGLRDGSSGGGFSAYDMGINGTSGFSNWLGWKASDISGGAISPLATSKIANSITGFLGKAFGRVGIGTSILGLSEAATQAISSLNLFGDKSTDIANTVDMVGRTISFAVYGSILGPFGAVATAAYGLATGLQEAEGRTKKQQEQEAQSKVLERKTQEQENVVNAVIAAYRKVPGNVFDERTEAADWVKTQMYEYLQSTPVADWDASKIYDRFVSAYRQKLGHEVMVDADNIGGFWNLQGQDVEYVSRVNGQPQLTEYGERLAKLIKAYNLVGYNSYERLMNTADETLVNEYLQTEKLNLAQIEFLEQQASQFESEVGEKVTASRDEITKAIEEAGSITDAIEAAKKAGDDSWASVLEAYQYLDRAAKNAKTTLGWQAAREAKTWSEQTAEELLGNGAGKLYSGWEGKDDFWGLFFNKDRGRIADLFGTNDIREIVTRIFNAASTADIDRTNMAKTEEERAAAQAIFDSYSGFLEKFRNGDIETGDWSAIRQALDEVVKTSIAAGYTDILANKLQYGLFGNKWTVDDWVKFLKAAFGDEYFAGGGKVKPIFRAGGGLGVDTVPAFLQPGEFVQRASAVSTAGLGVMHALNNGDLASAYRMIGSKISGHWNNSRNISNAADNRQSITNNTWILNRNRGGSVGSYNGWSNRLALGR